MLLLGWLVAIVVVTATIVARNAVIDSGSTQHIPLDDRDPPQASSPRTGGKLNRPILGVAINVHHITHLDWYLASVDRIAELGANSLLVVTPMWMKDVHDSEIRFLEDRCPTNPQIHAILDRANRHGLQTFLLPIVLLEEAEVKEWRGVIQPRDWDKWWRSYDEFLDRFIDIAERADVDVLSIGSELNSTEAMVDRWVRIADRVRRRFSGRVMYSANWDRYEKVTFWPVVDIIGVSAYFELVDTSEVPTLQRLTQSWARERERLLETAAEFNMPLLLSEVGYPSLPTAAAHPWNYINSDGLRADHETQAICWQAFFNAWSDRIAEPSGKAAGFFIYHWDPYHHGGPDDTRYGIAGKPAYEIIREGIAAIRTRSGG